MSTEPTSVELAVKGVKLNAAERAIAGVFPRWGTRRLGEKRQFAYECARPSRQRQIASRDDPVNGSQLQSDRLKGLIQVRDLEENDGLIRSILNKIPLYAVGRLRRQFRTGDRALDKELEWRFHLWSKNCERLHGSSLRAVTQLALRCAIRDGDAAIRFYDGPRNGERALQLELLEGDCIGGTDTISTPAKVGGVNLKNGVPFSYDLYTRSASNSYTLQGEESAQNVLHVLDQYRAGQYRGVSRLLPVVNTARDLKEIEDACKFGVKIENFGAGFITGGAGEFNDDPTSVTTVTTADGKPRTEETIAAGKWRYLPEGVSISNVKSDRPSMQFQAYLDTLIRKVGLALNLPMGFLYSLAGLSGPAARMDAQQAARAIEEWQTILIERALDPIVRRWVEFEVAVNDLRLPAGFTESDACNGLWMFAPSLTIDAGRDSAAAVAQVRMGMMTLQQWYAEDAKDAEEELDVIKDEAAGILTRALEVSKQVGVPVSRVIDLMSMRIGMTPEIAIGESREQPLVAVVGVGGAQVVNDAIAAVAAGGMTRDAAIAYVAKMTSQPVDEVSKWIAEVPVSNDPTMPADPLKALRAIADKIELSAEKETTTTETTQ